MIITIVDIISMGGLLRAKVGWLSMLKKAHIETTGKEEVTILSDILRSG